MVCDLFAAPLASYRPENNERDMLVLVAYFLATSSILLRKYARR
jgi:hypothetical protein